MPFLPLTELLSSAASAAAVLLGFFLVFYLLERWFGGDVMRYRTRHFWNDVAYALFYRGDLYQVLIGAALVNALEPRLAFLRVGLIESWPLPAAAVAFWISTDFLGYWLHRLQHKVPLLWAFHSVHHTQERLTFLTSYRIHPIEQLLASLILFVPLLVLGLPTGSWLPLVAGLTALEFAQHSELPWRFGPFYRVLVSPAFHAIHHSADARHYDRNFGKILSAWDVMFGTAAAERERPRRFGVDGLDLPESLAAQLVIPFKLLRTYYWPAAIDSVRADRSAEAEAIGVSNVNPTPAAAVATLLKRAAATIECDLRGPSMGETLPDGARLRVQCAERPALSVGDVIAFTAAGGLVVHRVVGRGLFGSARSYLLTRGDGSVLTDHPVRVDAVIGVVREWQHGGPWRPVPARAADVTFAIGQMLLCPIFIALHIQHRLAMAFTIAGFTARALVQKTRRLGWT